MKAFLNSDVIMKHRYGLLKLISIILAMVCVLSSVLVINSCTREEPPMIPDQTTDTIEEETTAAESTDSATAEETTPEETAPPVEPEPSASVRLKSLASDEGEINFDPDTLTYTVKLAAGRPRVPRLSAEADDENATVKIYDAMFSEGDTEALAKAVVTSGEESLTYTVQFVKDASLGFHLQYDDRYVFTPSYQLGDGESFTFESSDPNAAAVDSDGVVTAKKVSDARVEIKALVGGEVKEILVIDKIVRTQLNIFIIAGQSNAAGTYDAGLDYNAEVGKSKLCKVGTVYCVDVDVYGNRSALYDLSVGRTGFAPALGATWYELTGEKSMMIQSAFPGAPIECWEKDGDSYVGKNLYNNTLDTYKLYDRIFSSASSPYEVIRVGYFWCQGETAQAGTWTGSDWNFSGRKIMDAETYYEKFTAIHKNFVEEMDVDFASIALVRALASVSVKKNAVSQYLTDLVAPRVAQYALHSNADLSIGVMSRIGDIARSASAPDKTSPGYAYTGSENLHYTQTGYNEQGKELARNTYGMLSAEADKTATGFEVIAEDGRTRIQNGDKITVDVKKGSQIVGVVLPLYTETRGVTYAVVEGEDKIGIDEIGKITVKKGAAQGDTAQIKVTAESGAEITFTAVIGTVDRDALDGNMVDLVWNFDSLESDSLTETPLSPGGNYSFENGCIVMHDKVTDFSLGTPFMLSYQYDWSIEGRASATESSALFGTSRSHLNFIYVAYNVPVWSNPFRMVSNEGYEMHLEYGEYAAKNKDLNTWKVEYKSKTRMLTLYFLNESGEFEKVASKKWTQDFPFHITNLFGRYNDPNVQVCWGGVVDYVKVHAFVEK